MQRIDGESQVLPVNLTDSSRYVLAITVVPQPGHGILTFPFPLGTR